MHSTYLTPIKIILKKKKDDRIRPVQKYFHSWEVYSEVYHGLSQALEQNPTELKGSYGHEDPHT